MKELTMPNNNYRYKFSLFLMFFLLFVCTAGYAKDFYWENPFNISASQSFYPKTVTDDKNTYIIWQELEGKNIYLSIKKYTSLTESQERTRFAGPFAYSTDNVPELYSVSINDFGVICVAVQSGDSEVTVYTSKENSLDFSKFVIKDKMAGVGPRIFKTSQNTFKIFSSYVSDNYFVITSAESLDGIKWSSFKVLNLTPQSDSSIFRNLFSPFLLNTPNGDLLLFQASYNNTNQIFSSYFDSSSGTYTPCKQLTYDNHNQSPYAFMYNNQIYMAWENTKDINSAIYVAKLDEQALLERSSLNIISQSGNASRPILFTVDNKLNITWFDTRSGRESIYMAALNSNDWDEIEILEDNNINMFASPVFINNSLSFVFQQQNRNNINRIVLLTQDTSVLPPSIKPVNFTLGKAYNSPGKVSVLINYPSDPSGIVGYSYNWEYQNISAPENKLKKTGTSERDRTLEVSTQQEGQYTLSVTVRDAAGNWSKPAYLSYMLDLTAPEPPEFDILNLDEYGFVSSNTFRFNWLPSLSTDTAGYTYRIDKVSEIPKNLEVSKKHPMRLPKDQVIKTVQELYGKNQAQLLKERKVSNSIKTTNLQSIRYQNYPNGVYVVTVAAIDKAGNLGTSNNTLLILNKYQPSTTFSSVTQKTDNMGVSYLQINGSGFTYNGSISQVYLDKDGKLNPDGKYDYTFTSDQFVVASDKVIKNIVIDSDVQEGSYRIGLYHTDRGLYFTDSLVFKKERTGTLKIQSEYNPKPRFNTNFVNYKYVIQVYFIIKVLIGIAVLVTLLFILKYFYSVFKENLLIRNQISAIFGGRFMALQKSTNTSKVKIGLTKKLSMFSFILVILVVFSITIYNGMTQVQNQNYTMKSSLNNSINVLLESLCTGARDALLTYDTDKLSNLPEQKGALSEVNFITIYGHQDNQQNKISDLYYIWATNDPNYPPNVWDAGITQSDDPEIKKILENIYSDYKQKLESSTDLQDLIQKNKTEPSKLLRDQIDSKLLDLSKMLTGSYLQNVGSQFVVSDFDLDLQNTQYYFYRPVLFRNNRYANSYLHGVIIISVSTQDLVLQIINQIKKIIIFDIIVALIVISAGIIGSIIFAYFIVNPIKKLEKHVNLIGQTKDKKSLKNKTISIQTQDEIANLGQAINNMTMELAQNAETEELNLDGKAVQKAFLPLEMDGRNYKTYAQFDNGEIQCFGYYEGESGVSGDYFDYKRLDDTWYVFIKCDASGHGVPAAIIMTVVATLFREYFNSWQFKKKGISLSEIAERINDAIESLDLKGKFATMIICLLNHKTGELYMCNAGDSLVNIFDSQSRKVKTLKLHEAPTAGVFTSDMVNLRGGFKVEKTVLNKGDVLFLYTDGIEESVRRIRNSDFSVVQIETKSQVRNEKMHQIQEVIKMEDKKEDFGPERVHAIIESVFNKQKFILHKEQNPVQNESLEFDFSKCNGTLSEVIFALASIEKVFRMYKPNNLTSSDFIRIDRKIDEFLQIYFNNYNTYAANKVEIKDDDGNLISDMLNYFDYNQVLEDEQSDDLTMLAIRRL